MAYKPLTVLMWKVAVTRKRRFINTIIEIGFPILLFLLLFLFRNKLKTAGVTKLESPMEYALANLEEEIGRVLFGHPFSIVYAPDTEFTGRLMDAVGREMGMKRMDLGALDGSEHNESAYYALPKNTDMEAFLKNNSHIQAAVLFQKLTDTFPNLNYTLITKADYMTTTNKIFNDILYKPFVHLHWAIDKSYLRLLSGRRIHQTMSLQEIPLTDKIAGDYVATNILRIIIDIALFIPFLFLMIRLLEERSTGAQELVKLAGVSPIALTVSHYLNTLPAWLAFSLSGAILLKASPNPLLPNSSGVLIFLALALLFQTYILWGFACSFLFKRAQYTVMVACVIYFALSLPTSMISMANLDEKLILLTGFLPFSPMSWILKEIDNLEKKDQGMDFSTWSESHEKNNGSVLAAIVFTIVQVILLLPLIWYLTYVCPGAYGTAMSWDFCIKKKDSPETLEAEEHHEPVTRDPQYFEEPPTNLQAGIRIINVSKYFNKERALSDVSFDVYAGEITVLLGHNGAGKTTLMSIITGIYTATSGEIYVNGLNTRTQLRELRNQLGLCTQHNLLFPKLTVIEHIMFFCLLKGNSCQDARAETLDLLKKLELESKANDSSSKLSGGMKRRLQLGCALAGQATVLILDEPTSGLDVETRRDLWDLLLSFRGNRTVLITTHFMEEADALGDRVAALHQGVLRCHATPMHLKKHIGSGYRLSLITSGPSKEDEITAAVKSVIPVASLRQTSPNFISFNLPADNQKFPELFKQLESKKPELGISSMGISMTTLEDVFLKICSDVDTKLIQEELDTNTPDRVYKKLTGCPLYLQQMVALIKRHLLFLWSTKYHFLILQVITPIVLMLIMFLIVHYAKKGSSSKQLSESVALNLDKYKDLPEPRVFFNVEDVTSLKGMHHRYSRVNFTTVPQLNNTMRTLEDEDLWNYENYLAGIELDDNNAKVLYTRGVSSAAPVALNLLSNVLAAQFVPSDGETVVTHFLRSNEIVVPQSSNTITFLFPLFIFLSTLSYAATLPAQERAAGTRHVHVMAGCAPAVYWLSRLLFHALLYCIVLVVPVVVAVAAIGSYATLSQPAALGTLFAMLTFGMLAFVALAYLLSTEMSERNISISLTLIAFVGLISGMILGMVEINYEKPSNTVELVTSVLRTIIPPHALIAGVLKIGHVAEVNSFCDLNRESCPDVLKSIKGLDVKECCELKESPVLSYLDPRDPYPLTEFIYLGIQFIVYMSLVILIEYGLFNGILEKLKRNAPATAPRYATKEAVAEKMYVADAINKPLAQILDVLLVFDVHKSFSKYFTTITPVKGINFSVKKGECFGLLGVNGAGKTTAFKMIVAEIVATRGRLFANGHHLTLCRNRYLRTLGYCPQFFGLDEFLTGKQNLTLLSTLRGLNARDVAAEVDAWIRVVGLERYKDRPVSGYSGGCKRRMAAAAALSIGAPLTLLDEPTSGVDVSARRRVWSALRRGLRQNRAIILTSHSLDEMEALCDRIGIMVKGELCALGTPAALRAAHGLGQCVLLKIRTEAQTLPGGNETPQMIYLKNEMQNMFTCTLKDDRRSTLRYLVTGSLEYSEVFSKLEEIKHKFPNVIEDYTVTESTLEEVFLSFSTRTERITPK